MLACIHACTAVYVCVYVLLIILLLVVKMSYGCLNLFSRYSGVFPSLNMAVKRREQALQDYKRLQSKVEKYEEKDKTGPVMVKLHQVLCF